MNTKEFEERFWEKVDKDGPVCERFGTKCWVWTAGKFCNGYGEFKLNGTMKRAHVVSWAIANGRWPNEGFEVSHLCHNKACVNPEHLVEETHSENMKRSYDEGMINVATGERHGSRTHPESRPRGERHGMHTHPESRPRGERHGRCKLSQKQVDAICELKRLDPTISQRCLAMKYGVSQKQISRILNNKSREVSQTPSQELQNGCETPESDHQGRDQAAAERP